MTLIQTIHGLNYDQLRSVATNLDIAENSWTESSLRKRIRFDLSGYYMGESAEGTGTAVQILMLWRDLVYQVIDQRKVKETNKKRKSAILHQLQRLDSADALESPDQIESAVRDILLLLWEESSKTEREKFREVIKKDLEAHNVKLTEQELNLAIRNSLMGGAGGALPIVIPLISGILLKQMTKGFGAWIAVNLLGQKALQSSILGFISGPIGWGISVGSLGIGVVTSGLKYQRERRKFGFIQAILSIYSFSYQNRFNQRRRASAS